MTNLNGSHKIDMLREGDRVTLERPNGTFLTGIARRCGNGWELYSQLHPWTVEIHENTITKIEPV